MINGTLESVRRTQLYRTLPHEIGHYVDYLRSVEEPSRDDLDKRFQLDTQYHNRPLKEREAFAHRYADEFRQRMADESRLPFDRIVNEGEMRRLGLNPEWFAVPPAIALERHDRSESTATCKAIPEETP